MISSFLQRLSDWGRARAAAAGPLRDRFDDAMAMLRKASDEWTTPSFAKRLLGRAGYVYDLPLYVVLGAPGVGKTTILHKSGISFPQDRRLGGTRDCDWSFADKAVFLDTAGRFVMQGDAVADRADWRGFLSLLKKYRPLQPVNGVLLTVSAADAFDVRRADALRVHLGVLRWRLDELRRALGMSPPVYLLVNKCDLLQGFDEYFATLDDATRGQVWGFTLPLPIGAAAAVDRERLRGEFGLLRARLGDDLVATLQGEANLGRRERIYGFPRQFGALCESLAEALAETFAPAANGAPFLRGVYFCSAKQRTPGDDKVFFLHDLFEQVIVREAYVGASDRSRERRARQARWGAYACCCLATCAALFAWEVSYRGNSTYLAVVGQKVATLARRMEIMSATGLDEAVALLPVLDVATALPDSPSFKVDAPPLVRRFGLYQGRKMKTGAQLLYRRLLSERFGPSLKSVFEQSLRDWSFGDDESSAYRILKAYVMMHEPDRYEVDDFAAAVAVAWGKRSSDEKAVAVRHARELAGTKPPVSPTPMDTELVQSVRARLMSYTLVRRVYDRIKGSMKNDAQPGFSVVAEAGETAPRLFLSRSGLSLSKTVWPLFTRHGYHEMFRKGLDGVIAEIEREEDWVLGIVENDSGDPKEAAARRAQLKRDVEVLFLNDYADRWQEYVDDIELVKPRTLTEAAAIAEALSEVDSPLIGLLRGVVRETTLTEYERSSLFERIGGGFGSGAFDETLAKELVESRFADLRAFVNSSTRDISNSSLVTLVRGFKELYLVLSEAREAEARGLPLPPSALPTRMRAEAASLPQPARRMLEQMCERTEAMLMQKRQ